MRPNNHFFKWGFYVLLVLNIVLIGLQLTRTGPHPEPREDRFERIIRELTRDLHLNGGQQQKLIALFHRHSQEIDTLHKSMDKNRNRITECLEKGQDCDAVFLTLPSQKASFEKLLFQHHQRILKILNATQRKQYIAGLRRHHPPGPPF